MDLPHQAVASAVFGVPRVPRAAVRRPRLDRRIEELLDISDVVVLRGTAGAGKTVALADWAAERAATGAVTWITLDRQHTGRTQFWREIIHGLAARLPSAAGVLAERCLAALDAGIDPRTVLARFTPLIPPTIVVVDRGELIAAELFDDIVWAIQHNRHLKGVLASRRRTPLESTRTALTLDVGVLGGHELELTVDETAQLLSQLGSPLDPGRLCAATGGSPLLTRAAAEAAVRSPGLSADAATREAVAELFDYRAAESAVGREVLGFMARTALPESLTAELAVSLTGDDGASAMFDRFEERGWGMWSGNGPRSRFRYGSAIRAALLEAARHLDPRELDAARRTVIDHDLAAGNIVGALRGAVQIGDLDLASAITQRHHSSLLASEAAAVAALLESVPLVSMRRHPVLVMALAMCLNATAAGHTRAAELFLMAAACSRVYRGSVGPGQRVWLLTLESAALRFAGNLELALRQGRRAVQAFEEAPPALREELAPLEPTLYTQAGIAHLLAEEYGLARDLLARGAAASRHAGLAVGDFHATALLALALAYAGHMSECRKALERLSSGRWPPGLVDEYWATPYRLAQAREAVARRRYEEAASRLAEITPAMRVSEFWPLILTEEVAVGMVGGRSGPGIATLEARIRDAAKTPLTSSGAALLDWLRAVVHLVAGQPMKAEALLGRRRKRTPLLLMTLAAAALARNDAERAMAVLSEMPADASPWGRLHADLVRAAALARLGRTDAAQDTVGAAVVLARGHGLEPDVPLLPGQDREAVLAMILAHAPETRIAPALVPPAPSGPPLTPRELVVLHEIARGDRTTAEVAERLNVSANTVKSQTKSAYRKLGVGSRAEAVAEARRLGLLD